MSAFGGKADIGQRRLDVRFWHKADIPPCSADVCCDAQHGRLAMFEQVPHWWWDDEPGRPVWKGIGGALVAGDISAALPRMVRNSRRLMGSSSDRELTLPHC